MSKMQDYINKLASWYNCTEGGPVHKTIIDTYNSGRNPGAYKMTIEDPWCAAFLGAGAVACGLTNILPVTASCDGIIRWFKSKGQWHVKSGFSPQVGDIVVYDWGDGGASDHCGVITKKNGDKLTVLEGNMSNTVKYRSISEYSQSILGYGRPDWDSSDSKPVQSIPLYTDYYSKVTYQDKTRLFSYPLLYNGSKGVFVVILQAFLRVSMATDISIDGEFGPETDAAVRKWQKKMNLLVDGQVGRQTWASFFV